MKLFGNPENLFRLPTRGLRLGLIACLMAAIACDAQVAYHGQNRGHAPSQDGFPFPSATQTSGSPAAQELQKPSPGVPAPGVAPATTGTASTRSMLDQPATAAKIAVAGNRLSIEATNASLNDTIRQVAAQTGMQVEGNSRDQRVFGVYGPGSPPEVLSSLLYDSGYNVLMVGRMADGAPRRLVLSPRTAGAVPTQSASATSARNAEDDDEAEPSEQAQPGLMGAPTNPGLQPGAAPGTPNAPGNPGQVRTPQQMLEELQRLNRGQQPPQEAPHDTNPN